MRKNFLQVSKIAFLLFFTIQVAKAQVPIIEKDFDISRKSKNGYLGGIDVNNDKQTIDMVFVLKSTTKRKVKKEVYTFDKNLNLLNTVKEEEEIEKMKKRYKWFNFKGDSYVSNSLNASANLTGKLVFRKKQITWKYLWLNGSYNKSIKQLEKVKPTTNNAEKYFFRGGSYEVETDSTILVIAGKQATKGDYLGSMMHYDILSCDNQVNIKTVGTLDFAYPNAPIYSGPLEDDIQELSNDDFPRDWVLIFAPQGGPGLNKAADPKPTNYTYVRINAQGALVEKFNFNSPSNGWRVLGAYEKDGSVFTYGSATTKDPESKYINQIYKMNMVATTSADAEEKDESASKGFGGLGAGLSMLSGTADMGMTQGAIDNVLDELKYTNFQIGKISNGKFDFVNSASIEDFEKVQVKPTDQKKFVVFDGKKFVISGISFSSAGDILINGQDFKTTKSGKNAGKRIFKGAYMFHFDQAGNLKHNFGVFLDQSKTSGFFNRSPLTSDMIPATSYIQESGDKKNIYWLMRMAKSIHEESHTTYGFNSSTKTTTWEPLFNMEYGAINLIDGTLSDFKTLGESERRKFYLFKNANTAKMGNYTFMFSETERGDKVLISRLDLAK
ncbi:MAG: hypothetical protein EAZ15_00225 [Sphingobacteriales bacterium]|nr:MAG: hypothetical protein EAZ15_00225 [Sphingobacteriales bacterium]